MDKDKRIEELETALGIAVSSEMVKAMNKYWFQGGDDHFPEPDFLSTNIVLKARKRLEEKDKRIAVLEKALELACNEITPHVLAETSDYKGAWWGSMDNYFTQQAEGARE